MTTALETNTLALPDHAAAGQPDMLAPPFWGWQKYASPTPPGFWSHQNFVPADGTIVNQMGRQAGFNVGVKVTSFKRPGVDFGGGGLAIARIEPGPLTAIGYRVDQWAFLKAGGSYHQLRLRPGQPVTLAIRASGVRTLEVGSFQILTSGARYGEIICRVTSLTRHTVFEATAEKGTRGIAAELTAGLEQEHSNLLDQAMAEGKAEEVGFEPNSTFG